MKANSKAKRADAEKACEWYVRLNHDCVKTVRAVRTQFNRQDLFAADCVGKKTNGAHVYVQVTAGQSSAVSARKDKLEKIPWHPSDTVELIQLVQTPDPVNARKTLWFFRVHVYTTAEPFAKGARAWVTTGAVPVPAAWFKAYKEEE